MSLTARCDLVAVIPARTTFIRWEEPIAHEW